MWPYNIHSNTKLDLCLKAKLARGLRWHDSQTDINNVCTEITPNALQRLLGIYFGNRLFSKDFKNLQSDNSAQNSISTITSVTNKQTSLPLIWYLQITWGI